MTEPADAPNPVTAFAPETAGGDGPPSGGGDIRHAPGRRFSGEAVLKYVSLASAVGVLVLLAALLLVLGRAAWPSITANGLGFLTSSEWRANALVQPERAADGSPVLDDDGEPVMQTLPPVFGALPVIYGTAVSSAIALLIAVPLSLGTALFLVRAAPRWLAPPASFLVEFLAAIPSIAYGMWGLLVLAPFLMGNVPVWGPLAWVDDVPGLSWLTERQPNYDTPDADDTQVVFRGVEPLVRAVLSPLPGTSWLFSEQKTIFPGTPLEKKLDSERPLNGRDMFCGGLVLAIMIVPIITAVARDILRQVPRIQVEGTLALGATWWQSCREMLRYSRSALFGAIMLGLARAAGETMAVTMVIGNVKQIVASPFAPAQTMSSLLANEFGEAAIGSMQRAALCEVALVLLLMSLVFNVVARQLVVGRNARTSAAA